MSTIQMIQGWLSASRKRLPRSVCMGMIFAASVQRCFGAGVTVLVTNAPKGTSSIEIAADGPAIVAPLLLSAVPNGSGNAAFVLNFAPLAGTRIRSIAVKGPNSNVFPLILAAAGIQVSQNGAAKILLDFGQQPLTMTIDRIVDNNDGTATVAATFASFGEFFSQGQVVNLWASPTLPQRAAAGKLFLATLIPSANTFGAQPIRGASAASVASVFEADFKIPKNYASGYLQVGYHGLDFQQSVQIPLLVGWLYPHVPIGASAAVPRLNSEDVELGTRALGPSQSPGTYSVRAGPNGRLELVRQ
jgi:hypothetical protein